MSRRRRADGPLHLYITADDSSFDPTTLQHFHEEGFQVTYLPYGKGGKAYQHELEHLADDLEAGEVYGIVAYGTAASTCLSFHHTKTQPKLACLIAYYPTTLLNPLATYPPHLEILCHLASTQPFAPAFRSYTYSDSVPGFAEHDLAEYDPVSASLAWTRTLGTLRRAFGVEKEDEIEGVKEEFADALFGLRDAGAAVLKFTTTGPGSVNYVPTMTGGIGTEELLSFYRDYFIPNNPPSLVVKLVSRTIGVDRVVDEMVVSFTHTQIMPWILPGVPATGKTVRVAMVSAVCVRGGKLVHERVYWDQAGVLVQVGLLDPKLVPEGFREKGLERLPVCGEEAAVKVLDFESRPTNEMVAGWSEGGKEEVSLPTRPAQAAAGGRP